MLLSVDMSIHKIIHLIDVINSAGTLLRFINLYFKLLTGELPKAEDFGEKDKEDFPSLLEQICIFGEQLY